MLDDTSFAIHPGKKKSLDNTPYHDIGSLVNYEEKNGVHSFQCEHGNVDLIVYSADIIRIVMNPFSEPKHLSSAALAGKFENAEVPVKEAEDIITIQTDNVHASISKKPFRLSFFAPDGTPILSEGKKGMGFKESNEVICFKEMAAEDHFYGFGEKSGFLDKRGEKFEMWNTDVYAPHNPETDPLYESIPYFMGLGKGKAYGIFFDNTFKTVFDMKTSEEEYSFFAEGGQLDYYFLAGPSPKEVVSQYTRLTGTMPLPPKWALGYHQSRYSYETEQEVRELAGTFLEKGIPLDVIYLDIHYMDGYRVFTFDRDRFPSPDKMVDDLKKAGIRIVPIVDPGVKKDPEYSAYQEGIRGDRFCKYIEGDVYYGEVWPGKSAFPDFTQKDVRKWWGSKHSFYTDLGIEGIWNDMNEPAVFNETKTMDTEVIHENDGKPATHRELHNIYGLLMGKATYEGMKQQLDGKRPFLLTRAGYSGVQRYAAVWTGDNRSFWEHLQMSLPMCMNLGLSGVAFTGPDVGGFAHDSNGELLARWTQVGAFTPYFRNHSAIGTVRQEPWSFGEKYEAVIKKYIELRYKWLPHLYSLFKEASDKGLPVMRPLFMEYPDDPNTYTMSDQFMIGSSVIAAPIMTPGTTHRAVCLPEGSWVDYWDGTVYDGGQFILYRAELDTLPLFIKKGSFLVHGTVKQSTEAKEENPVIHLFAAENGTASFTLYDDDGKTFSYMDGNYIELGFEARFTPGGIDVIIEKSGAGFDSGWKSWTLSVHCAGDNQELVVNGKKMDRDSAKDTSGTANYRVTL
ncbi:glycoside hydrolase family 31 protein [Bacillus marinisedimentorum]|uniref:glycoside hydrolase family 31 protein n=1 Tax=Bacillus marinisedimentorum TaxID=1821260 RepID=UPI0008724456|nr:glycoside hydrolase family 31 protein [Bacillus marinisedimentorum]